jgi:hypothetical protein
MKVNKFFSNVEIKGIKRQRKKVFCEKDAKNDVLRFIGKNT